MRQEAVSDYFVVNGELCSTQHSEIFESLSQDSLYEVVKLVNGKPLFFEEHMQRFRASAASYLLIIPHSDEEISLEIARLSKQNQQLQINCKLLYCHQPDQDIFLTYMVPSEYPSPDSYTHGIHTILFSGVRENPNIKTLKGSFRYRVKSAREEANAYEALLTDGEGCISEGSRSNIFFVKKGMIYTPPAQTVLMGITRKHVMAICQQQGLKVVETRLHRDELAELDGAFLTGTTVDVLPVASIDGLQLDSMNCPEIRMIIEQYTQQMQSYLDNPGP
ncbi:aminotransferase class IV [Dongshaea marina]|uniref:aminotransferase class IV n=1 Tax=Dongshaea marina TaxID=2047966 RepID=UPI000D3E4757|nr:aminotransferase class IV [Dongshaea marina]